MKIQKLKEKINIRIKEAIKKITEEKPENFKTPYIPGPKKEFKERAAFRIREKSEDFKLIFPPNMKFGDFTFDCFPLAKKFKKTPAEIANMISEKIKSDEIIKEITIIGPYMNLKITNSALFSVIEEVLEEKDNFGNSRDEKEKVMIEYLGPNTNKPLHLGHARNGSLGIALANIFEKTGRKVLKANIINDRGIHICKSMLAYQKWGENSTPELLNIKSDHFVGSWYVRYDQELQDNPELENEIQEMLQKWENGDKEILKLWEKMNEWVYAGWKTTLEELGFKFDVIDYESENYKLGKEIIDDGLKKGIFEGNANEAVIFNLPEKEFGLDKDGNAKKITLVRADGTSVYVTQDIGTAVFRVEKYNLDRLIYVVGLEQVYHFQCLFEILKSLNYKWAKNLFHLSYGMITLPEGKMKSREGKVVDVDDLILEMKKIATEELKKRYSEEKIDNADLKERVRKIALGAIKFYFLRVGANQNIEFNPQESISFDGFTGPYCQYAYARIASIIRKSESKSESEEKTNPTQSPDRRIVYNKIDFKILGNNIEERELIKKIIEFPDLIKKSALEYNPSVIAVNIFETAQLFNKFYQKHKVLNAETEELKNSRLALIQAVQIVLKVGLNLLGIETLEKM